MNRDGWDILYGEKQRFIHHNTAQKTDLAYALYSDRLTFTILGIIVYFCVVPLLVANKLLPLSFLVNHVWLATGAIAVAAIYFTGSLLKTRIMSSVQIAVFVSAWILYAFAYVYLLREDGLLEPDTPVEFIVFRAGVCPSVSTVALSAFNSVALATGTPAPASRGSSRAASLA